MVLCGILETPKSAFLFFLFFFFFFVKKFGSIYYVITLGFRHTTSQDLEVLYTSQVKSSQFIYSQTYNKQATRASNFKQHGEYTVEEHASD